MVSLSIPILSLSRDKQPYLTPAEPTDNPHGAHTEPIRSPYGAINPGVLPDFVPEFAIIKTAVVFFFFSINPSIYSH